MIVILVSSLLNLSILILNRGVAGFINSENISLSIYYSPKSEVQRATSPTGTVAGPT